MAVTTPGQTADALNNPLLPPEPIESVDRIVEDHITTNNDTGDALPTRSVHSTIGPPHGAVH